MALGSLVVLELACAALRPSAALGLAFALRPSAALELAYALLPSAALERPSLFGPRLRLSRPSLFGLRLCLNRLALFGLRLLLSWPALLFGLRLRLSWLTLFGLRLLAGWPMLFDLWRFLVHRRSRLLSPGRWFVIGLLSLDLEATGVRDPRETPEPWNTPARGVAATAGSP